MKVKRKRSHSVGRVVAASRIVLFFFSFENSQSAIEELLPEQSVDIIINDSQSSRL